MPNYFQIGPVGLNKKKYFKSPIIQTGKTSLSSEGHVLERSE